MSQRNPNAARPVLDSVNTEIQDNGASNPYAAAILQFIEEIKDDKDKRSRFYKEVVVEACNIHISGMGSNTHLALSKYVQRIEAEHQKKSSTRKALTSLQPLVTGLYQFTSAMDVMIQADHTGAGCLIYGGAKLVLELANGYTRYFEELSRMLAEIGHQLQCFDHYTKAFASDKQMNGLLFSAYKDILIFWKEASGILNQKGKKFLLRGFLKPFNEKYENFKGKLERNARRILQAGEALHVMEQKDFNNTQTLQVQGLADKIAVIASQGLQKDTRKSEIRKWIAGGRMIDPESDLERHLSSRHHGTSQWIFENTQLTQWLDSEESTALWINARPGTGKSKCILMATVIERLRGVEIVQNQPVIYFFCQHDVPDKCRALSTLRSISLQALDLVKHIPDDIYALYDVEYSVEKNYIGDVEVAEKVVEQLLRRIPRVHIIIDGMDECSEITLLDSLIRLHAKPSFGIIKWLLSSRNESEIIKKFSKTKFEKLSVPKAMVQKDIKLFLEDNSGFFCGTPDHLDLIAEVSDGVFLEARLAVDPFANDDITCVEEFDEMMKNFQPGLSRGWFRSLQKLTPKSERLQELAKTIFNSVLLAAQPMTFIEIVDLLSIQIGDSPDSRRRPNKSAIESACAPFIEFDYNTDFSKPTLRVAHKTVHDFLCQDPRTLDFVTEDCYKFFVNSTTGNLEIGEKCLTYLSYKRYESLGDPWAIIENKEEHGFLIYAAVFWHYHLLRAGGSEDLFQKILNLFRGPNFCFLLKVQSRYAPHLFAKMSFSKEKGGFRVHSPKSFYGDSIFQETFYADAMPLWLQEYDNKGDNLALGYHLFVREWSDILIQYPEGIQEYFSGALGHHSFRTSKKGGSVRLIALEDSEKERVVLDKKSANFQVRKYWMSNSIFTQQPEGLRCQIASLSEDIEPPIVTLEEWSIDGTSRSKEDFPRRINLHHVPLRREVTPGSKAVSIPRAPSPHSSASNGGGSPIKKFNPTLLSIDSEPKDGSGTTLDNIPFNFLQHRCLSNIMENCFWFLRAPQQKPNISPAIDSSFPPNLTYIRDVLQTQTYRGTWILHSKKTVYKEDTWATTFRFKLVEETDDNGDKFDGENSDEDEEGDGVGQTETTIIHEPAIWFLSINKLDGSIHWFHRTTKSGILQKSIPTFHPHKPLLLWAQNKVKILVVDLETGTANVLNLPVTKAPELQEAVQTTPLLVSQELHISSSLLQRVAIYCNLKSPFLTITQSFFTLHQENNTQQISATIHPHRTTQWRYPGRTLHLPTSLAWAEGVLYAALGSSHVTLLKFPPEPNIPNSPITEEVSPQSISNTTPAPPPQIQTLTKPLYIPSSSYHRYPHFFITPSHATFAINSMSIGKPIIQLPPLVMEFDISAGSEFQWKDYEGPSIGQGELDTLDGYSKYIKGAYASKENAFRVPIRSGLEWTKGTYVTCW